MVDQAIIEAAARLKPRRILVTGGSGFVGSQLARTLAAGGHEVVACGRNPYRVPFPLAGPKFVRCDLTDAEQLRRASESCDLVYHAGALASPWGRARDFHEVNVEGTRNVVEACLANNVQRMVHVSSTAVHFDYRAATNVREDAPLAKPFANDYAASKAAAEQVVRQAVDSGLDAVVIRARAVFGPGDSNLLPRILASVSGGRLRQIGSQPTVIDLAYIDNLVQALIQAADRGAPGEVFTITDGQKVELWPFIHNLLQAAGHPVQLRTVPKPLALAVARAYEVCWRLGRWRGEPPVTRYSAAVVSTTKTFCIDAAREKLAYKPVVTSDEGSQRTAAALTTRNDTHASTHVSITFFSTGYTRVRANMVDPNASRAEYQHFHALVALIDHPTQGLTLFDTGYSPRFFEATERWPYRLYRRITPVVTSDRLGIANLLTEQGIDPSDVRRIVLSHFHADHMCGLRDFPNADVIARGNAWRACAGKTGMRALRQAYLPSLVPSDLPRRLFTLDHFHDPGIGPFERTHDLFADGSVRLLDLPGHAAGQIGLLLQSGAQQRVLLIADAAWTCQGLRETEPPTWAFRWLAASAKDAVATIEKLRVFAKQFPDVELIPTHCPEVAQRHDFDSFVEQRLEAAADAGQGTRPCAS